MDNGGVKMGSEVTNDKEKKREITDAISKWIPLLTREFDNLIRYEVHQSQIWLIFFVKS